MDIGKTVKDAAETVADKAAAATRTVRKEIGKAWDELSADDPEGCPLGEENEDDPADDTKAENGIPTIHARPDDSEKE